MLIQRRGQSLIEVMIAITIIIVGVAAAVDLARFNLKSSNTSQSRLVASYLAMEALEMAVNIRDSNALAQVPFSQGLEQGGDSDAILTFNPLDNSWFFDFSANGPNSAATTMYLDQGYYRQTGAVPTGEATMFHRLVTLDASNLANGSLTVTAVVRWKELGAIKSFSLTRVLYDWK